MASLYYCYYILSHILPSILLSPRFTLYQLSSHFFQSQHIDFIQVYLLYVKPPNLHIHLDSMLRPNPTHFQFHLPTGPVTKTTFLFTCSKATRAHTKARFTNYISFFTIHTTTRNMYAFEVDIEKTFHYTRKKTISRNV